MKVSSKFAESIKEKPASADKLHDSSGLKVKLGSTKPAEKKSPSAAPNDSSIAFNLRKTRSSTAASNKENIAPQGKVSHVTPSKKVVSTQ